MNHKATTILVLLALTAVATTGVRSFSRSRAPNVRRAAHQAQTDAEQKKRRQEFENQFPAVNYDAPAPELDDHDKRARRKAKNSRYDKYSLGLSDATPRVNETSIETERSLHIEALPAAQSEAVLVGEVLKAEAHLSNNKKGVYSEFTIRVDEVLKDDEAARVAPGSLITAERLGGAVVYPAGNRRVIRVAGQSMPRINRRYVLFLNATEYSQDFKLLTAYELRAGKVFPLDDSTRMNAYRGMAEEAFLNLVRDAVGQSRQRDVR